MTISHHFEDARNKRLWTQFAKNSEQMIPITDYLLLGMIYEHLMLTNEIERTVLDLGCPECIFLYFP